MFANNDSVIIANTNNIDKFNKEVGFVHGL